MVVSSIDGSLRGQKEKLDADDVDLTVGGALEILPACFLL